MQTKIDAITAPAAVLTGSGFLSMNYMMENGLPFLALLFNVILAAVGILVMFSKWRISRIEYKRALMELEAAQNGD